MRRKASEKFFWSCPSTFFALKVQLVVWWALSWWSVQFGEFLVCCSSTHVAPLCPAICDWRPEVNEPTPDKLRHPISENVLLNKQQISGGGACLHCYQLNIPNFRLIYTTYIRPRLEFCIQAWSPHYIKDIEILENVQKAATKLVQKLRKFSYSTRLRMLGITSLKERRVRGDMIEVYSASVATALWRYINFVLLLLLLRINDRKRTDQSWAVLYTSRSSL